MNSNLDYRLALEIKYESAAGHKNSLVMDFGQARALYDVFLQGHRGIVPIVVYKDYDEYIGDKGAFTEPTAHGLNLGVVLSMEIAEIGRFIDDDLGEFERWREAVS